jgi:hypothetical protein
VSPPDGQACNSLTEPTKSVTVNCEQTSPLPIPSGGTVADGTYVMTAATFYADGDTCPAAETDHTQWLICGTSWQTSQNATVSGGQTTTLDLNATVTTMGTQVSIDVTCGYAQMEPPFVFGYDADSTTLRLYVGGGGNATSGRVDTFTKQ